MSWVSRGYDALLRSAARRWPDDIADDMLREWRAELAAVPTTTRRARTAWQRFTFAVSLACSPGPGRTPSVAGIWSDRAATTGLGLAYLAMLGGVVLASTAIAGVNESAGSYVGRLSGYDFGAMNVARVLLAALSIVPMMWLARLATNAFPHRGAARAPVRAVAVTVLPMTAVLGLFDYYTRGPNARNPVSGGAGIWGPIGAGVVLAVGLVAGLMLTRRGRRRLGVLVAGAATLIAADFAFGLSTQPDAHALGIGATGTLALLPASLLAWGSVHFGQYFPAGVHTVNGVTFSGGDEYGSDMVLNSTLALTILLCMAFAARYAWRLATRSAPAPEPAAEVPVFGPPLAPRWVRLAAVPLGLIGAGVWIYSTAFAGYDRIGDPSRAIMLVDRGTQYDQVGLVVMVAAVALLLAGRAPLLAPLAIAYLVPVAAERALLQTGWAVTRMAPSAPSAASDSVAAGALAVVGIAAVTGAGLLARALSTRGADAAVARRILLTLAVVTAVLIPNSVFNSAAATVAGYVAAGLAWTVALLLAGTARLGGIRPLPLAVLLVVPGAAALYGVPPEHFEHLYGPAPNLMIPLTLGLLVAAYGTWQKPRRPVLAAGAWAAGIAATGALSMVLRDILEAPATAIWILFRSPGDASGESAALIGLGIAIGLAAGRGFRKSPPPAPQPPPSPQPGPELIPA